MPDKAWMLDRIFPEKKKTELAQFSLVVVVVGVGPYLNMLFSSIRIIVLL